MTTRRLGRALFVFLLAAFSTGVFSGCQARETPSVAGTSRSEKKFRIGYSFYSLTPSWFASYQRAFKAEQQQLPNFEIDWFDGNPDPEAITAAMEGWIARKVDGIMSSSPDHMPLRLTYKKALEAGIPVILTGDPPDYPVLHYMSAFSGLSGWDGSRMAAELLNEALGGRGRIACITGPRGSASEQQSTEGFKSALLRLSSKMQIAATEDGRWNATVAYLKSLDILTRVPNIDAFYAADDIMGNAVIRALKEKGYKPGQVKVVARGGSKGSIADLKEGWYLGIINQDPVLCARQDIWMMTALLEEKRSLPNIAQVRQEMITQENAAQFPGW
jgi:ABC-type sugar transport system substrate-binding protein